MAALSVGDLTVRYGSVTAVRGVSFDVAAGSVLGLVGESGSGKSTVARALVGLTPATGSMRIDGADLSSRQARRRVQLVFQDSRSSLDPRYTVEQCVAEGLTGVRGRAASARVAELLDLVSLDPAVAGSRPGDLSGGQRQRVAIARALAARPDVVIADEVTASLDVSVQAVVLNLLRRLRAELGLTMIFISHNLAVVEYMCDDLAVMFDGRIVEYGAVGEVIGRPEHPYTRSLLAAVPEIGQRRLLSESDVEASAVTDPASAGGCAYRLRCPIGPAANPEREICVTTEPAATAAHAHHAACHFARELDDPVGPRG
ncbi:oligopeptide/dipeptide ABC transporter ATP-binding protein [Nonomuraea fuscirosea]|jgi:peptide/nickel transport system ATP-binding protein|uniref:ABC transporter ATP-binding protein n=1 Tax=Nonomuraea fuscirosea TaxID=1291556 RepID=UPI002DD97DFF|nr:oligopeptide/dipeptide ABC transporter ATP-binding protein [Nonomuraea fuscirosea]WSA48620.1 ATP-binding cassette domain-containing protein [Nonomuraea fuscirosea]